MIRRCGNPASEAFLVARPAVVSKLSISTQSGGVRITEGNTMSENSSENPTAESADKGAEEAGKLEEQSKGGYGGPEPEDEVAPGFEAENDGGS